MPALESTDLMPPAGVLRCRDDQQDRSAGAVLGVAVHGGRSSKASRWTQMNRGPAGDARPAEPKGRTDSDCFIPWPDFGRTTALNVAAYCALLNSILPGQRVAEQVEEIPETFYGSEGWGFESLRARHISACQGRFSS